MNLVLAIALIGVPAAVMAGSVPVASGVPALSSNPGAAVKIYLDFNGDEGGGSMFGFNISSTPAYGMDSDATTFSPEELAGINEIWSRIAEKLSPFNLDVTTLDPGTYADGKALKVVIGGDGMWFNSGHYSGASIQGSFYQAAPNVVYQFSSPFRGTASGVASFAVREIGHSFGADWQAAFNPSGAMISAWNLGNSEIDPLMGKDLYAVRGLWWQGKTGMATPQDDLTFIGIGGTMFIGGSVTSSFGFRADDLGATTPLTGSGAALSASGVIERSTDTDSFSFSTSGGQVVINVNGAEYGQMLNPKFQVFNSVTGQQVAQSLDAGLNESLTTTLPAGEYVITVGGHGLIDCYDANGFHQGKGYDIGSYSLSVTRPAPSGSLCDVNKDGVTNVLDFQLTVTMALGVRSCTADINLDGRCDILDAQRVVNAATFGLCVSQ